MVHHRTTERRRSPPTQRQSPPREAWAPPATDAPNSLGQLAQNTSRERPRRRYAESKERLPTTGSSRTNNLQRAYVQIASSTSNRRHNNHRDPPDQRSDQEQAARRWVSHSTTPSSPSKRKRPPIIDHSLGLPTLASPLPEDEIDEQQRQQQNRTPPIKNTTSARHSSQTKENQPPLYTVTSSESDSTLDTAQKSALTCVNHASRRQAAAKAALSATSQITSSLQDLLGDSNKAVSVARQSRVEAENAAVRVEGAAIKVKQASGLAAKDKQRASLELDEANAQAEEAWEFLRRVKGASSKGHKKLEKHLQLSMSLQKESAAAAVSAAGKSVLIGTVIEVHGDSDTNDSSAANPLSPHKHSIHSVLQQTDAKKQKSESKPSRVPVGRVHWENSLSQSQMKIPAPVQSSTPQCPVGSGNTSTRQDALIEPILKFKGHTSPVTQIAVVDHKRFISSSWDTTVRMWDADTGACLRTFRGHRDWVHAISVLDRRHFISGSDDRTIKLWNVDSEECVRTFEGHSSFVKALSPMPGGDKFLSGSRDRTVKLFAVATGGCLQTFEGHVDVVSAIVALDSNHFATGSHDNNIKYWNISSKSCSRTLVGHTGSIKTLAAVSDTEIVSGSDDKVIRLWNVTTGKCLREFGSKTSLVFSVTYICEGFFLSCGGNNIKLYHIPSGACVKSYETPRISLACIRLDDERFVTGSDQMLHLWKF